MNPNTSAADAYRQATFENAPPIKIVRMMYQGALRFLEEAQKIDPAQDPNGFRERLHRAEAVIVELRISLEPQFAPELCADLERLYLFAEAGIHQAIEENDHAPIEGARDVLHKLFSAWKEIEVSETAGEAA